MSLSSSVVTSRVCPQLEAKHFLSLHSAVCWVLHIKNNQFIRQSSSNLKRSSHQTCADKVNPKSCAVRGYLVAWLSLKTRSVFVSRWGQSALMPKCSGIQGLVGGLRCERSAGLNSLGTRLMALRGLSTRTVLTAEKLTFSRLREYSNILRHTERKKKNMFRNSSNEQQQSA